MALFECYSKEGIKYVPSSKDPVWSPPPASTLAVGNSKPKLHLDPRGMANIANAVAEANYIKGANDFLTKSCTERVPILIRDCKGSP